MPKKITSKLKNTKNTDRFLYGYACAIDDMDKAINVYNEHNRNKTAEGLATFVLEALLAQNEALRETACALEQINNLEG